MFEFTITLPDATATSSSGDFLTTLLATILAILFLGIVVIFLVRAFFHRERRVRRNAFHTVVLLVTLPKESAEVEKGGKSEERLDRIQEGIGVAETLLSSIAGQKAERGIKAWFFGRSDQMAFEIVAQNGQISFYVAVTRKMQEFIEQQIHAQYSDAYIEEVEDYNIFPAHGVMVGTMLVSKRAMAFPLKTYRKLEADPLNSLTNTMSKIPEGEGAAIQYVIRSARSDWRKRGVKIASLMQQGKKLDEATRLAGGLGAFMNKVMPKGGGKKKDGGAPKEAHRLTPLEDEMVKSIEEKAAKLGLDVNIRIVVGAKTKERAQATLASMVSSFSQYYAPQYGNILKKNAPNTKKLVHDFIFRNFDDRRRVVLNTEEFASLFHFPLSYTETPNIRWLLARKAPPPTNLPTEGLVLGHVAYRGIDAVVRIKRGDRRRHAYIIGRSGSGKTVLMQNMVVQDILNGDGVGVVDPHGEFVEYVLEHIPKERADDVIVFDPSDYERPMGLNMLEYENEDQKDMAVQEMIDIFYKLFPPEMIGPQFEHHMRNVMLTLMSDKEVNGTIAEIPRMFSDVDFQKKWVAKVTDPVVRSYWEKEVAKTSDFHKSEMLGYLISKVGRFVENAAMRNIIGQQKSGFNIRKAMDEKKILLVNLSKGKTGEVNSKLLGLIIVSQLQMAALSRANMAEKDRSDFYLYIDEFQNFITPAISTILSEARKYHLNLTMAHQYMAQLVDKQDTSVRDAILGNAGTMCVYRIGVEDAEVLEKEFTPTFNAYDLVNAEQHSAYVKLLIDNTASKPFSMKVYAPTKGDRELADAMKQLSRLKYARPREIIEAEILERSQLGVTSAAPPKIVERTL